MATNTYVILVDTTADSDAAKALERSIGKRGNSIFASYKAAEFHAQFNGVSKIQKRRNREEWSLYDIDGVFVGKIRQHFS